MIYLNNQVEFWELQEELPDSYWVGTTMEEYEQGANILLNADQIAFHIAHPEATPRECFEMEMSPTRSIYALEEAKSHKLNEIYKADKDSEKFFIDVVKFKKDENGNILTDESGVQLKEKIDEYSLWLDKNMRTSMYTLTLPAFDSKGYTTRKFWTNDGNNRVVEVPINWAISKIPELEVYATQTYDILASNKALVNNAMTIAEVNAIDAFAGYPDYIRFEFDID